MTWSSEPAGPALGSGTARRLLPAVLVGLLSGLLVQVLALVTLTLVVLFTHPTGTVDTALTIQVAVPGALGLAVACGVAARWCRWRCEVRQVPGTVARRAAPLTGAALGAVVLGLGLTLALNWITLPIYLVGLLSGTVLGTGLRPRSPSWT